MFTLVNSAVISSSNMVKDYNVAKLMSSTSLNLWSLFFLLLKHVNVGKTDAQKIVKEIFYKLDHTNLFDNIFEHSSF
jgi:hypothetical protein